MKEYRVYYIWENIATKERQVTIYDYPALKIGYCFLGWRVVDYAEELIDDEEEEV